MEARKPVFGKSNSVEDMQHVRLMALLQELEREHGRKGAAADGGAGAAGRARDDAAPGDVPAAGLRAGRADRLAQDRALRHAESAGSVGASAARAHPVAVAEVAGSPVRAVVVNFCEHFGGSLRKGACRPSHRGAGPGDNECAVWLSPRFPTIETWVRDPCCTGMTGG